MMLFKIKHPGDQTGLPELHPCQCQTSNMMAKHLQEYTTMAGVSVGGRDFSRKEAVQQSGWTTHSAWQPECRGPGFQVMDKKRTHFT